MVHDMTLNQRHIEESQQASDGKATELTSPTSLMLLRQVEQTSTRPITIARLERLRTSENMPLTHTMGIKTEV